MNAKLTRLAKKRTQISFVLIVSFAFIVMIFVTMKVVPN